METQLENKKEKDFVDEVLTKWWEDKDPEDYEDYDVNSLIEETAKIAFQIKEQEIKLGV